MKKRGPWFRKAPPLAIEFLEDRVTPAAIFDLWGGTLSIGGTDQSDFIRVIPAASNFAITVNHEARSFAIVEVLRLHINARGGNDKVVIADTVTLAVWVSGGAGDDLIQSGSGDDVLEGNAGQDNIEGGAGDDVMSGGFGDDIIRGGAGNDEIDGDESPSAELSNEANDPVGPALASAEGEPQAVLEPSVVESSNATVIEASSDERPGNDQIFGDAGDDTIRGGEGNDLIIGGTGNDQLFGNAGDDRIRGGAGDDLIDGGPGTDRATGNAGHDRVEPDAGDKSSGPQAVDLRVPQAADRAAPIVRATDVDELLAPAQIELPVQVQQANSGSNTTGASETPNAAGQRPVTIEAPFEFVSVTSSSEMGIGAGLTSQLAPASGEVTENNADLLVGRAESNSDSAIAGQVDLLLQGALLTEATTDSPTQPNFLAINKGRRRPTFLYIKPLPLPA